MDDSFKILAILGALAWIPQLFIIIKNWLIKPKIKIIPANQLEIGYTTFGPIINTSIAIVAENKKALIDKIEIELTHENNDTQKFKWIWFEETLHVVDLPDFGGSLPTRKNQNAIAINILKDELIEKRIGFQQNTFQIEQKALVQNIIEELIRYSNTNKPNDEIKSSKSYNELKDLFQNSFNWKVGKYALKYSVFENSIKNPFVRTISFKMTSLDLARLKLNIDKCISEMDRSYIDSNIEYPEWSWTNVIIND